MNRLRMSLLVLVLLTGVLTMLAVGCNSGDDPIAKTGTVAVSFGATTKADVVDPVQVNVTFSHLAMRNLSGDPSVTLINGSETVDLAGDALDGFDVPEGRYHCLAMTVTDAEVVEGEGDAAKHCSFGNLLSTLSDRFEEVCLGGDGFLVSEGGSYTVLVDAGFSASCPVDGGTPAFAFTGVPSLQLVN